MDNLKEPIVRQELLDYLQRLFPDRLPELSDTDRAIWFNRGAAEVVRHLVVLHERQSENILRT
ncbi:hypothetical protein [Bradyrhizobium sp. SZCCHNRI2049]|uniref:hypothetical protein n=1 Tax=Bradyrhizobium sp. SZCCHNRI2049 TaxID=3057287 RepID=UPI0029164B78|nr:hypothetical protein [Bradyrhizobium sp. SZCCHNRI2049]